MATVQITAENFDELVQTHDMVLIDWWAPWCGPCRAFGPIYERVAAKHPDIVFGKLNTEEERELSSGFGIHAIPTLMIVREKVVIFAQPGMLPEKALEKLIAQAQSLDMNEVRREVAAERAKQRGATGEAVA